MSWVRIDDGFPMHRKARLVGPHGVALAVAGLCYCARYLTDGKIPKTDLAMVWPWRDMRLARVAARLVAGGVWVDGGHEYVVHDYLEYNPSRAEVLAERAKKTEAGRRGGLASAAARAEAPGSAGAEVPAKQVLREPLNPIPVPSRPVPSDLKEHRSKTDQEEAPAVALGDVGLFKFIEAEFSRRRVAAGHAAFKSNRSDYQPQTDAKDFIEHESGRCVVPPERVIAASMGGFFANAFASGAGFPFKMWASDVGKWVTAKEKVARAAE